MAFFLDFLWDFSRNLSRKSRNFIFGIPSIPSSISRKTCKMSPKSSFFLNLLGICFGFLMELQLGFHSRSLGTNTHINTLRRLLDDGENYSDNRIQQLKEKTALMEHSISRDHWDHRETIRRSSTTAINHILYLHWRCVIYEAPHTPSIVELIPKVWA